MEVVVKHEYEALQDDELTLRPGDVIKNVQYIEEDGWMEGDLNGKRGLFPVNFVKELKKDSKEVKETKSEPKEDASPSQRREKSAGNVANLVQRMSIIGIPTGGFQPPQPPAASKKPKKRQCKVLFGYQPQNEDELELKVGDILDITEEIEEGWWSGVINGKSGLFPSNFVKELDASEEDPESNETTSDETDGSATEVTGTPTSPQPPSGNEAIAHPKKIRGIGFGDIFKEGSVKLRVRLPSPEAQERKEKPVPSLPSATKPAHPNMTDSQRADGDSKPKAKEYCKVTFCYDATNEDELSLKEGDIVHLLSKDTGEPGWWRGEVGGREGVFPNNFVALVTEAEKEPPASRGSVKSSPKQESEEGRDNFILNPSPYKKRKSRFDGGHSQKPRKPPPPSKSTALKPEVPSADKKPHLVRPEDKVDRATPEHKSKPAAPVVPPKKPVPPPLKNRPGSIPPKRPDKPLAPSPNLKHNGEVASIRPKSDLEPSLPTKPKTLSGDWGEKPSETEDLMSFDDVSSSLEKLSHPTANRPKMPGRRLPAQFGGAHSPNKEVSVEKSFKMDEDDATKPKQAETRKPSANTLSQSPALHRPNETKPSPAVAHNSDISAPQTARSRPEPEESSLQLDELKNQMKDLLLSVELLKAQQMKEIAELRGELDEERLKRVTLQLEVEKLKKSIHST